MLLINESKNLHRDFQGSKKNGGTKLTFTLEELADLGVIVSGVLYRLTSSGLLKVNTDVLAEYRKEMETLRNLNECDYENGAIADLRAGVEHELLQKSAYWCSPMRTSPAAYWCDMALFNEAGEYLDQQYALNTCDWSHSDT